MSDIPITNSTGTSEAKAKNLIDKSVAANVEVTAYLEKYGMRSPEAVKRLRVATFERFGPRARMMLDMTGSSYLSWLASLMNAKRVLEVGTFTGSTSLNLGLRVAGVAEAKSERTADDASLPVSDFVIEDESTLVKRVTDVSQPKLVLTLDVDSQTLEESGLPFWRECGKSLKPSTDYVRPVLQFKKGSAVDSMTTMVNALVPEGSSSPKEGLGFDIIFIDADKNNYKNYYELGLKLLRPGGVIAVDNTLWGGRVIQVDPSLWHEGTQMTVEERESRVDKSTQSIHELNAAIHSDSRVTMCLLPTGDGLMLATKK